jgi:DNA-binding IclR family transcriptional regulator
MTSDLEAVREEISSLINEKLPNGISSITVEPSVDPDGDEFWLVTVALQHADFDDDALEALLEEIETRVARVDDRYPSVRFQDAA